MGLIFLTWLTEEKEEEKQMYSFKYMSFDIYAKNLKRLFIHMLNRSMIIYSCIYLLDEENSVCISWSQNEIGKVLGWLATQ